LLVLICCLVSLMSGVMGQNGGLAGWRYYHGMDVFDTGWACTERRPTLCLPGVCNYSWEGNPGQDTRALHRYIREHWWSVLHFSLFPSLTSGHFFSFFLVLFFSCYLFFYILLALIWSFHDRMEFLMWLSRPLLCGSGRMRILAFSIRFMLLYRSDCISISMATLPCLCSTALSPSSDLAITTVA